MSRSPGVVRELGEATKNWRAAPATYSADALLTRRLSSWHVMIPAKVGAALRTGAIKADRVARGPTFGRAAVRQSPDPFLPGGRGGPAPARPVRWMAASRRGPAGRLPPIADGSLASRGKATTGRTSALPDMRGRGSGNPLDVMPAPRGRFHGTDPGESGRKRRARTDPGRGGA